MAVFSNDDNKLINFRPICVFAICFLMGIYCAFQMINEAYLAMLIPIVILLAVLLVIKLIQKDNFKPSIFLVLCFFLAFAIGVSSFMVRAGVAKRATAPSDSGVFVGTISEISNYEQGNYIIIFRDCTVNGKKLGHKSICYAYSDHVKQELSVGGRYYFECSVKSAYEKDKSDFDVYKGVHFLVYAKQDITYLEDDCNLFDGIKNYLSQFLKNGLSEDAFGLALALTIGDTSNLSFDALTNYRMAGIAHVFAVSGLHVGTLALVLSFIARKLKMGSMGILLFTSIPLLFYCGICGFTPSSLRAFIMSVTLLLANVIGFKRDSLSAVALAAIIIALFNPVCIFEKGFQLSFACVISIVILSPVFQRGIKGGGQGKSAIATALSVQVGTLPIITDMCGYMSIISLLSNLIFVPIIMICYQITMVVVPISIVLSLIFGSGVNAFFIIDSILQLVSNFINLFSFENAILPITFGASASIYYLGVIFASDIVNVGVKNKILIAGVCLVFTVLFLVL